MAISVPSPSRPPAAQARALTCAATLESVPMEELASTTTIAGENDAEASKLLAEADAMTYGND